MFGSLTSSLMGVAGLTLSVIGGLYSFNWGYMTWKSVAIDDKLQQLWQVDPGAVANYLAPAGYGLFAFGICILFLPLLLLPICLCCSGARHIICTVGIAVILLLQIIIVSAYFGNRLSLMGTNSNILTKQMYAYVSTASTDQQSRYAALLMETYQCCGATNGADFSGADAKFSKEDTVNGKTYTNLAYPVACCKPGFGASATDCPNEFTDANSNIKIGCTNALYPALAKWTDFLVYVALFPLVVCAVCLPCLLCTICKPELF